MPDDPKQTEEQLRQQFLTAGSNFFSWNSGKNTPNVLDQLKSNVAKLDEGIREASGSLSDRASQLDKSIQDGSELLSGKVSKLDESIREANKSLSDRVSKLDESIREASASSTKLASALNHLTRWAVIIAACSLVAYIVFEYEKLKLQP